MQTARRSNHPHRGVSRINRIECLAIRSKGGVSRSTDKMGTSWPYRRIDPLILLCQKNFDVMCTLCCKSRDTARTA